MSPTTLSSCSIIDCARSTKGGARGWCKLHYYRWNRNGDPLATKRAELDLTVDERFWNRLRETADGCWEWAEYVDEKGYGRFWDGSRTIRAHQYSYSALVGDVPAGLELDHLCRNRRCANPYHLDPVTHAVNMARSDNILLANAAKSHCLRGHEFTPENTYAKNDGGRQCRACDRERTRKEAR